MIDWHLFSLPLNHELTRRGDRFLRAVSTYPDYRICSLPRRPLLWPGLLRCEPKMGAPIEMETWALPFPGLSDFVAGIPVPLCIGPLDLAEGLHTKGPPLAATGAVIAGEIVPFGGWRASVAGYQIEGLEPTSTNTACVIPPKPTIAADA